MSLSDMTKRAARKNIESLYEDSCTVYQMKEAFDTQTKRTKSEPVPVFSDQPCRISFSRSDAAGIPDPASEVTQPVKLFLAPELEIEPGSRIDVTRQGRTTSYQRTGVPAVYSTHQEIRLELFERWA